MASLTMCQYWKPSRPKNLKGFIEFKAKVTFSLLNVLAWNESPSKSMLRLGGVREVVYLVMDG